MQWSEPSSSFHTSPLVALRCGSIPIPHKTARLYDGRPSAIPLFASSSSSPPPPYEAAHFAMPSYSSSDCTEPSMHPRRSNRRPLNQSILHADDTFYNQVGSRPGLVGGASISHLREALSNLDTKMASLMSQRHELETHLEHAVRQQSPIQRLPQELLASIFVAGVFDLGDEDPVMVSTLMLVCRHWADVAVDTPVLWSRIVVSTLDSLEKAKRKLARSKSIPLDVTINFSPRVEHASGVTENIIHAMDMIRPTLWRVRSLRLSVPTRPQAHQALLRCQEDAPLLEELSIRIFHSMQEDHHPGPRLSLFNNCTPRLHSCSFTSFNFGWDAKVVSRLRVLKLCGYWNGFSPSVDTLLEVLRGCPELEELALRNMSDIDSDNCLPFEQECATPKCVRLPRLVKASFYYAGIMRTRMVLGQIAFPALESLEFCYLDNLTPVIEHLRQQSLTSLPLRHLRIESSFFNEQKLVNLMSRLTSLTTLELVDIEDVSAHLFKSLSTPLPAYPWLCPKLDILNIDGCTGIEWENLRAFIESRLPGQLSSRPRPRQQLALPSSTSLPQSLSSASVSAHIYSLQANRPNSAFSYSALPHRLRSIDVTRCHQISKEMLQWLKMYVSEVKSEPAKGVWGEPVLP